MQAQAGQVAGGGAGGVDNDPERKSAQLRPTCARTLNRLLYRHHLLSYSLEMRDAARARDKEDDVSDND